MRKIKVKIIYRNYIPLYSCYCSFWLSKIPGIEIIIPSAETKLKKLYKIYRYVRKFPFATQVVSLFQKLIFPQAKESEDIDVYFYAGILPSKNIKKPFVVDFEHIYQLFNFGDVTERSKKNVLEILQKDECKKILPWSMAAENTLERLYEDEYKLLKDKVEVLYPAYPLYLDHYKDRADYSIVKKGDDLKLLFIGRDYNRKGLIELLEAFRVVMKNHANVKFYCVSDLPAKLQDKYTNDRTYFFPGAFPHEDILRKFFMTCDLYVMPTHEDTYGVVYAEALSCGVPVVCTRQFALPELVKEGKNGFFVESDVLFLEKYLIPSKVENGANYKGVEKKLVKSLIEKIGFVANNRNILKPMEKECIKDFKAGGKFSLETRNKKLQRIFTEAVIK